MADEQKLIKKIKLSNGEIYSIFDTGAIRLNADNVLVTGNTVVDKIILDGHLYIKEIDDQPVENTIDNLVTMVLDETTGRYTLRKRSTEKILEDIGGASYSMNNTTGILTLKTGKQN